jgi:two-component system, OmpR family, sensor histidine kinase ChvG
LNIPFTRIKIGPVSPITRRILAINFLALGILVIGLLSLGGYQRSLVATELSSLRNQAEMFSGALGEGAIFGDSTSDYQLAQELALQIVRRLATSSDTRARLFDSNGKVIADSHLLSGPGGIIEIEELPTPEGLYTGFLSDATNPILKAFKTMFKAFSNLVFFPSYNERPIHKAIDYYEVQRALLGEGEIMVRTTKDGFLLSVAVPVQRYKRVLGALMLSKGSAGINETLFQVRLDIIKIFVVALMITIGLSIYLASSIAQPIRRLADAAQRVRHGHHRQHSIPDFSEQKDEITELGLSLRDMTEALWQRMDAIERFAADVAHELKNPLTSLRSAVETAQKIKDPEKQRDLMAIIHDDVERLDRLISDISDASRLDAELSRDEEGVVNLFALLETLTALHESEAEQKNVRLALKPAAQSDLPSDLSVVGLESRIARVVTNLVSNAISFSPPQGVVTVSAQKMDQWVKIEVADEGPGIPEGKEADIFNRFYSERPEGEKFGTHSGLGLSIAKQIVDAHNGTITARNEYDQTGKTIGACFTVLFPAAPPASP